MAKQGKVHDGKSLQFTAAAGGVLKGEFYRREGINHVAWESAAAGVLYEGDVDPAAVFRIQIGAGVAAARGAVLYIPAADGNATAITATAAGNVPALFVVEAKDANNYVEARLLNIPA